jgi:hypothetical protein
MNFDQKHPQRKPETSNFWDLTHLFQPEFDDLRILKRKGAMKSTAL